MRTILISAIVSVMLYFIYDVWGFEIALILILSMIWAELASIEVKINK